MFAARRPPKRHAQGLYPRFVAVAGTWVSVGIVPLPPQQISPLFYVVSLFLLTVGTASAICSVIALARSISIMPEARHLVMWGPFSLVRHPLYLAEMTATAGLAMQYLMPWALVLLGLLCFFTFERMKNEERVLIEAFQNYRDYMARTARLLPGFYKVGKPLPRRLALSHHWCRTAVWRPQVCDRFHSGSTQKCSSFLCAVQEAVVGPKRRFAAAQRLSVMGGHSCRRWRWGLTIF